MVKIFPGTWHLAPDTHFMQYAIRIGARGLGRTAPNPSVGCVLVKDGQVLAAARTADGGRPHAETEALRLAGDRARGATAYVSLEPCAHHGVTPPCAQALIKAGIARVVVALVDQDVRVAGKGVAMLEAAGVKVSGSRFQVPGKSNFLLTPDTWNLEPDFRGFFRRIQHHLPYVALKLATSADGFLGTQNSMPRWITSDTARAHCHRVRSTMDAVVTGIGTVLADDPLLTVRLPGMAHARCVRVVCDRRLRLPLTSKLVRTAEMQPVWVLTTATAVEEAASHATELREAGVVLHVVEDALLAPLTILRILGENGLSRVLIEAGAALSAAFLEARAVDRLYHYHAPMVLGNAGTHPIPRLEAALAGRTPDFLTPLGPDLLYGYELASCLPD